MGNQSSKSKTRRHKKTRLNIKTTTSNSNPSNRTKTFKKINCAPSLNLQKHDFTCYTDDALNRLKKYWNIRHPDRAITSNISQEIWTQLKNNMSDVCDTESCWMRQKFMENNLDDQLRNYVFAPKSPASWKKNKNEWLTSVDIVKVMKQFEHTHKNFAFLGPSPIDFDKRERPDKCVWDDLCRFELSKHIKKGKTKIGIIFNTDPSYKSGSHWISMMIDIPKKIVYYFDSAGDKCPKQITAFAERVVEQGKKLNLDMKFLQNHPFRHQKGNTECGVYALYFITEMIKGVQDYDVFTKKRFTDKEIERYRTILFNLRD